MPATAADQRTLWPGYVWPGDPPASPPAQAWVDFGDFASAGQDSGGSVAVMNPASGPGAAVARGWTAVVNRTRAHGHRVLGYVDTNYGDRPAVDVETDIDLYYAWYAVDGVFFDRMSNDVADKSYYQARYAYVKTRPGVHLVAGNPGVGAATDWQIKAPKSADLLVVHENTAAAYLTWTPPAWAAGYPAATFAHLVHSCAAGDFAAVRARTKILDAGYLYVTDDTLPNPYDTLAYWPAQATP